MRLFVVPAGRCIPIKKDSPGYHRQKRFERLVDLAGIEPTTSSMPWKRAPSCATGPLVGDSTTDCLLRTTTSILADLAHIVNATDFFRAFHWHFCHNYSCTPPAQFLKNNLERGRDASEVHLCNGRSCVFTRQGIGCGFHRLPFGGAGIEGQPDEVRSVSECRSGNHVAVSARRSFRDRRRRRNRFGSGALRAIHARQTFSRQ